MSGVKCKGVCARSRTDSTTVDGTVLERFCLELVADMLETSPLNWRSLALVTRIKREVKISSNVTSEPVVPKAYTSDRAWMPFRALPERITCTTRLIHFQLLPNSPPFPPMGVIVVQLMKTNNADRQKLRLQVAESCLGPVNIAETVRYLCRRCFRLRRTRPPTV